MSPARQNQSIVFDLQRIIAETFVQDVDYHETIDSTNNVALKHCRGEDLSGPLLVLAAEQTSGRGRGANQWWSAQGALTFSLVVQPAQLGLSEDHWPRASLTTGLSVCLALDEVIPAAGLSLKWPNDVFLNRRKVCGVLVEVGSRPSQTLVLGIGVNVNNLFGENAPRELAMIATSLADTTGREFDLSELLIRILQQLEVQFRRLASDDPHLAGDWRQRCILRGLTVTVETESDATTGVCRGIDEAGALVLETDRGTARLFGGVVTRIS